MSHIVITGASSGIGEALALHYADKDTQLSLCRSQSKSTRVRSRSMP
jgi:short-subunit dehydrogenase